MNSTGLYTLTVLIWGSTWFAITFQLGEVAVAVSLVWRFALAALLLIAFCLVTKKPMGFSPSQHVRMAAQGFFLFAANYLVFYEAQYTLASGLVAVVFSTILFWNTALGALFLGLKIRPQVIFGGLFGLFGLALVFVPDLSFSGVDASGLGLAIFATLLASIGNILSASNQKAGLPILQTNAYGMAYGAGVMAVFALFAGFPFVIEATAGYLISLAYLAVFGSAIAFGAYLTLIGRIGPDKAAYATVLFPLVALTISTLFEGYEWTLQAGIGVILILAGNVLALKPPKARPDTVLKEQPS
ncbi:MAG: DMT family transporter [Magnetovibrionaceae bacterium]